MNDHPETLKLPVGRPDCVRVQRVVAERGRAGGFTIIEVLIVVVIIGILVGIAYPSYTRYTREARRSDAHLALLSGAQAMERCRATAFSYADCDVPEKSPEQLYTLALSDKTANTWTLTATATSLQSQDTDCPTITLDHLGAQGPVSGSDPSECWN